MKSIFTSKRVDISISKVELAIAGKMAGKQLQKLTALCQNIDENNTCKNDLEHIKFLKQSIFEQLDEFSRVQKKLIAQQSISWKTAF